VRRLYSTFAHGPPGIGLLLIRLVAGITAIAHGVSSLHGGPALESALLHLLCMSLGSFLLIGLWTPIAGTLLALAALWNAFAYPEYRWYGIVIGTLGAALALLGPGTWSIDARLFGWKRLKIGGRD
jgi:uncharacterized membrane protein YphA (DoxX/SURF4 family)